MIGSLIAAEIFLMYIFLAKKKKADKWWLLPVVLASLLMQILCVPYPEETFYWYTGAVNYTFVFSLSLILFGLFYWLSETKITEKKFGVLVILAELIAVCVGGNNHATSLSSFLTLCIGSLLLFIYNRRGFWRTVSITLTMGICIAITSLAPSNFTRMETEFADQGMGAFEAVIMSLVRTATNIYSWTNSTMILLIIWMIPFFWKVTKDMQYKFKWPIVFSLVTFGIFSSQLTAALFASGLVAARRMADIIFYSYHVWLISNVCYWVGWVAHNKDSKFFMWIQRHVLLWTAVVAGMAAICLLTTTDLKNLTTYKAYNWLKNGYAESYAESWEERLEQLKNPKIRKCYFEPINYTEGMIVYTDLFAGDHWVNTSCAQYYDKDYVGLKD